MIGKVVKISGRRSDDFRHVEVVTGNYTTGLFVHESFKLEVGEQVEYDVDEDGDAHIVDVIGRRA